MITGINIVRNCIQTGYPFIEAILSAYPMCGEYLVNDGGSTDGTLEALITLSHVYPHLRVLQIPDGDNIRWDSVSDQINQMISESQGDILFLGNADELIHERDLPRVTKFLEITPWLPVYRFDRKEIKQDWSGFGEDVYHPARLTHNVEGLYQDWNSYGGDEFMQRHPEGRKWFDPNRRMKMCIDLHHLYNMFPENRVEKLRNDAEYLAPGDKQRVRTYEKLKDSAPQYMKPKQVWGGLPALARGLPYMGKYHIRECLYDVDWVEKVTGLNYGEVNV